MNKYFVFFLGCLSLISCEDKLEFPNLSNVTVTEIENNKANASCFITNDGNSHIDTIGICWSKSEAPTTNDSKYFLENSNTLDYIITGLIPKTKYYIRAFAINEKGLSYGSEISFTTLSNETDIFIDARDGQSYKIVKIGEKWWFAENLNYWTGDGSWYFNNDSLTYSALGRLYNNESAIKAIPTGWKLPTENDWRNIEKELGLSIEEINMSHWRGLGLADYLLDNREFDFDVKWNGIRDETQAALFFNDGSAYFWTSTQNTDITDVEKWYYCRHLMENSGSIRRLSKANSDGLSVRCVRE